MAPLYEDRFAAGRRLASVLTGLDLSQPIVLALPRGGVPVAAEVARALDAPLDLLLVRKIGAPGQPELAVAAVAEGALQPIVEIDGHTLAASGVDEAYVWGELPAHLAEIARRRRLYLGHDEMLPVAGATVIVVDDGVATGTTLRAALHALRRRRPARIVAAMPVAPRAEAQRLRGLADVWLCPAELERLGAVGMHYEDFDQTSDEEVCALLDQARATFRETQAPRVRAPRTAR